MLKQKKKNGQRSEKLQYELQVNGRGGQVSNNIYMMHTFETVRPFLVLTNIMLKLHFDTLEVVLKLSGSYELILYLCSDLFLLQIVTRY